MPWLDLEQDVIHAGMSSCAGAHKRLDNDEISFRRRRVKCDETKPVCDRCTKFGVRCEGYPPVIVDKTQLPLRELASKSGTTTPRLVHHINPSNMSLNEEEGRYFRHYCENLAAHIPGHHQTTIWGRIIPQAAESEPFIQHAMVALAALTKSSGLESYGKSPLGGLKMTQTMDSHLKCALIQYDRALVTMRNALNYDMQDVRNALIAGLLVFCVESILGRHGSASQHAINAVNLFYRWKFGRRTETRSGIVYSAQQITIEDDLSSAYFGLDLQALLFLGEAQRSTEERLKADMDLAIKTMPSMFKDLEECRKYLDLLSRRNSYFRAPIQAALRQGGFSTVKTSQDTAGLGDSSIAVSAENQVPLALVKERDQCLQDIQRWRNASVQLFSNFTLQEPHSDNNFIIAMMRIHAAMNVIRLVSTFTPPEIVYDAYIQEFESITRLSAAIQPLLVSFSSTKTMFHFDIGIIYPLIQVGMYCRAPEIRAQAIQLLLKHPGYREGLWNSFVSGVVCDATREVEEEFLDKDGLIPPDRRASINSLAISTVRRSAHISWKQGTGNGTNEFTIREKVLKW